MKGKRLIGGRRGRCEDNIKMDFRDIGWENVDCIHLAQDRDQRRVMDLRDP
jgi:hypothetical protein